MPLCSDYDGYDKYGIDVFLESFWSPFESTDPGYAEIVWSEGLTAELKKQMEYRQRQENVCKVWYPSE